MGTIAKVHWAGKGEEKPDRGGDRNLGHRVEEKRRSRNSSALLPANSRVMGTSEVQLSWKQGEKMSLVTCLMSHMALWGEPSPLVCQYTACATTHRSDGHSSHGCLFECAESQSNFPMWTPICSGPGYSEASRSTERGMHGESPASIGLGIVTLLSFLLQQILAQFLQQ